MSQTIDNAMIYLDYNATTPIPQQVFESMVPFLTEQWGNPSSSYGFGAKIRSYIAEARTNVASLVGAKRGRTVFTSGATEANNTVLHSVLSLPTESRHIVTTVVEHPSVIETCHYLSRYHGVKVSFIPVHQNGMLDLDAFTSAISTNPSLVSIMWANNETGVIFPIEELCQMSRELGAIFHTDASQVVGKLPIDVSAMPIDFLTLTGHKFGAPKGIGALYISRNSSLPPLVNGGHQELGLRGGTEAVALIAGINKASILAYKSSRQFDSHVRPLRDRLESSILDHISDSQVNGDQSPRLANTTNISFRGIASEALLLLLDQAGICASSGSACMALSDEASYVINAMVGIERARSAVRFSMGLSTTDEEIDRTIDVVTKIVLRIRGS